MAGNKEVSDLPLVADPSTGDMYIVKAATDFRVRAAQANGIATLDGTGKLPTAQLPVITKFDVGLGNVDNTADLSKPVSTAQAAADSLRVLKSGDTMSGQLTVNADIVCTGSMASGGNFIGGSFVVVATTGSNVVVLRPNGVGSTSGQMTLDSAGTATTVNFVSSSDRTLKDEIAYISKPRDFEALRLATWKWKNNGHAGIGVIAQDVQAYAPEYVFTCSDGTLGVDKAGLALDAVVNALAQIKELQNEVAKLRTLLVDQGSDDK